MFSVIIPCYNAEEDLSDALKSVLQQTAQEWITEIIVVDDGSEDGSSEVGKRFAAEHEKIRYIYQENQGPSVARNTGLRLARGKYLAFLDADDVWLDHKLKRQGEFVRAHPEVGLVCSDFFLQDGDTRRRVRARHFEYHRSDNLEKLFVHSGPVLMSTVVMKRACFDTVENFDPDLPPSEDADLWLRVTRQFPIHHMRSPLTVKRVRAGSVGADPVKRARTLQQITDKLIGLSPELAPLRKRRSAMIQSLYAHALLEKGDRRGAREAARQALRLDLRNVNSYPLLFLSLLPLSTDRQQLLLRILGDVKKAFLRL